MPNHAPRPQGFTQIKKIGCVLKIEMSDRFDFMFIKTNDFMQFYSNFRKEKVPFFAIFKYIKKGGNHDFFPQKSLKNVRFQLSGQFKINQILQFSKHTDFFEFG